MAIPMERLGGRAFHSADNDDVEREYDRLREQARLENDKAHQASQRSQQAFHANDHEASQRYSRESKQHYARRDDYNRQAAEYIFRENNAPGRVDGDAVDLHGLFVDEAERVLEQRIRADQARGLEHLHAIVGKGNHSTGHVQKIKPKVEELCRELRLRYRTEENAGRIYINLQGGEPLAPGQQNPGEQNHGGQNHGGQNHGGQQQQQQHGGQQDEMEELVGKLLPKIMKKLEKACCAVM
ncbi:hypothetical protein E4U42_004413 [Claviceps africana]|uniref:Smr domain-containing protein n=1 Tax=Claviceps africana TaxID=83212 RepID=A0A8K0J6A8_9HYPO|nr:hypothetical protein E4U42_004413 [Claviceps africana]